MTTCEGGAENARRLSHFCVTARALARCLTSLMPEFCDAAFSNAAREMLDGEAPQVDDLTPVGVWLRVPPGPAPGAVPGYIYIGPPGSPHFYTREKPVDVDDSQMETLKEAPPGRLIGEVTAFLDEARKLETGEAMRIGGGEVWLTCPPEERTSVTAARVALENALSTIDGKAAAAAALRASMSDHFGMLGKPRDKAAEAASQPIAAMRAAYAADARLASLALLRPALIHALPAGGVSDRLASKSFECLGAGGDPEMMLGQVIQDYAIAGQAVLLTDWLDKTIFAIRDEIETAKNALTIDAHGDALYRVADAAYTGRAIAQVLMEMVPSDRWPPGITSEILEGYVNQTEEKMVRSAHALTIAAMNAGSALPLSRHRAAVKLQGEAKADELIEDYYFYPRCARDLLLH